jgi:hypothetical protein
LGEVDVSAEFIGTGLVEIILPASVQVLGEWCFSFCSSLSSITFESSSRLPRIDKSAFNQTGFVEIITPASVEVLGENCWEMKRGFSVKLNGLAV